MNGKIGLYQLGYWAVALNLLTVFGMTVGWKYTWLLGVAAGILNQSYTRAVTNRVLEA